MFDLTLEEYGPDKDFGPAESIVIKQGERVVVTIAETGVSYEIQEILTMRADGIRTQHHLTALEPSMYEQAQRELAE